MNLHHFTCDAGYAGILQDGFIVPRRHPLLGGPAVVWLTQEAAPRRESIGLTSHSLSCDRMAHRITVAPERPLHWYSARILFDRDGIRELEVARGARPATWWLALGPIEVTA